MIARKGFILSIALLFVLAVALLMSACARKQASEKIIAVINGYKMTVEDFNYESKEVLSTGKMLGEIPITREDVLDALIVKEVLIQEAQKRDFDKDRDFMKTIELYWEQTLIRNLMKEESKEIERRVSVYENEITEYYNKTKEKIRAKVLVLADERAGRRLLGFEGDVAGYAETQPKKSSLLYIIPSRLYTLGEDNIPLENNVFGIDRNKNRELLEINGKWGLIIIEERVPASPEPLSAARNKIIKIIRTKKERDLMNEWMDTLRRDARIKIYKKVLVELQ